MVLISVTRIGQARAELCSRLIAYREDFFFNKKGREPKKGAAFNQIVGTMRP
jgi:hypothetical protein